MKASTLAKILMKSPDARVVLKNDTKLHQISIIRVPMEENKEAFRRYGMAKKKVKLIIIELGQEAKL